MKIAFLLFFIPLVWGYLGGPRDDSSRDLARGCDLLCWILRLFAPSRFNGPCQSSEDCNDEWYCAAGICQKYGSCRSDFDCRNPENLYPVIECTGPLVCSPQFECGRICGPTCEDGTFGVSCPLLPCDIAEGICESDFVSCQNDFCGECTALVFDAAGHPESCDLPTPCNQTSDCDSDEYCASGLCKKMGKCSSIADCFNPENLYPVIECVGPIDCDASGQCGRTCTGSFCPEDKQPVQCFAAPCDTIEGSCNQTVANCVDYYCGGCDAFIFDAAGNEICQNDPPDLGPAWCSSIDDCDKGEYCAGGECLPQGSCIADLDCLNPSNLYPLAACVGVINCEDSGSCGIDCGTSFCPPGSDEVTCFANPCDTPLTCVEDYAYCIPNYCDGSCDVILLDAAGNELNCTTPSP